ncbi:hypothetical protein DL96DRAFT_1686086 [Flagelloscypha sp. PMI_526]|nr:hypothetical protein DL96DRAFT_1686086 [Flagelloscypha sp. PMI_526]
MIVEDTKDAGEAASKVPYVKAVAGVLSQIIKIRDEIQAHKDRCGEIIDLVQLKSRTILQSLDQVYDATGVTGLENLKSDLEEYAENSFLQAVLREELEPFKTPSRWISYINRGKNSGDLQKLERELDEFKDRFSVCHTTCRNISRSSFQTLQSAQPAKVVPQALPTSPDVVIGRESVVESVVTIIISSSRPRVAILGSGGIGKTTIGTTVLHDSRLAPTVELLETRIADALSIPMSERGTDVVSQIVNRICSDANPVLLYIDNLETVWDVESEQPKVDRFLELLSGAKTNFALLITMRGTQEPKTSFSWEPCIVGGVDSSSSITIYELLSKKPAEASTHELLLQLRGSPLAIKLFALMVKEGDKPSQLLSSWNERGAKVLEIGGKHRLSSLEQSIHLSVFSPRIDDTARLILGLISLMPDGLSTCSPWFEGFESTLPDNAVLQPILRALRRTALLDEVGEPSRWQMLPPIRQFCLQLIDSTSSTLISLIQLYIETVGKHWDYSSSTSQAVILPEMANIRGLLLHSSNLEPSPSRIGYAITEYVGWASWQGIDESTILSSFLRLSNPSNEQAALYQKLGMVHHYWGRLDAAEISFASALKLYGDARDPVGEANIHILSGKLLTSQDQLDAAEASFTHALTLYCATQNRLGEANTRQSIGTLHMRRDQLKAAEASFVHSLELYGDIHHRLGEANTHFEIGGPHIRQGRLDSAELSFTRALELQGEVRNRLGEATAHESIGKIYILRDQLDAAESSFTHALKLYGEVHSRSGEASTHESLGNIHMRRDQLDAAESSFNHALEIYCEIQNRLGAGSACQSLGRLFMRRDQLDAAMSSFSYALKVYSETQNRFGEANARYSIGNLHVRRGQLDAAKALVTLTLGEYREIKYKWGIANCTFLLGQICFREQKLEAADSAFSQALMFWEDIGDYRNFAETHQAIGDLYLKRMQLDEAEMSLNRALDIYTTKVACRTLEALTNRSIGELHLFRGQFEGSEQAFRRALKLDTAASSRVGQGQSYRCLGGMFMKKGDPDAAESFYVDALRLFLEIEDYQASPCLLDLGKVWVQQGKIGKVGRIEGEDVELLRSSWDARGET